MTALSSFWVSATVAAVLCASGCSTTRHAGRVASASLVQDLRATGAEMEVEVVLPPVAPSQPSSSAPPVVEPIPPLGKLVDVDETTVTVWFRDVPLSPGAPPTTLVVPLGNVRRIRATNHLRGAYEGGVLGALAAIAVGVAIYARTTDRCNLADGNVDEICFTPLAAGILVAGLLGGATIPLGAWLGHAVGDQTDVTFGPE